MINTESKSSVTLKRTATMKDANHKSNSAKNEDVFKVYTSKEGKEALTELMEVRDLFNQGAKPSQTEEEKDNKPKTFSTVID